jgi:hypothetical protein
MRRSGQSKGVFCLEGQWDADLRKTTSVRAVLQLLHDNCDIDYVFRDCATEQEFAYYIGRWVLRQYDAFPILYLASHGEAFSLCLGQHTCDLDELAGMLEGRCQNRLVVCASCSTLDVDKRHLKRFLKRTEALAICGYCLDVDWMKSTAFELLLLSELQANEFSGRGIGAIASRLAETAKMFPALDFRIVTCQEL